MHTRLLIKTGPCLLCMALITTVFIGCSSGPEDKLKYFEQAKALYESKNYKKRNLF